MIAVGQRRNRQLALVSLLLRRTIAKFLALGGNSVPPSKGYGHQVRQGELDADLMDFGGGHHRTGVRFDLKFPGISNSISSVSNPPSSSSVYPGITSRSSTPAAPQVRAEDLNREALKAARLKAKEERIRAKHVPCIPLAMSVRTVSL